MDHAIHATRADVGWRWCLRRPGILYLCVIIREFRWTLILLGLLISVGGILTSLAPRPETGLRYDLLSGFYGAWMAMLAQPLDSPPATWYLKIVDALYPVFGAILIGEGVVRFALLMVSRRHGEKEWMRVMASTYRDHIVLCGLGHLGYRVLEQLVAAGIPVVGIEKDENGRFVASAKALGIPILIRNMKEDQSLLDAGIGSARAVIIATNDDMANLEVALDSRRMNPGIRIIMRLFDQQIAAKIADALTIDAAFSASSLAAPIVAALSMEAKVTSSLVIGDVLYVSAELPVDAQSPLAGRTIQDLEAAYSLRILARLRGGGGAAESLPPPGAIVAPGDALVVHTAASRLSALAAATRRPAAPAQQAVGSGNG